MTVRDAAQRVLDGLPEELREELRGVRLCVLPRPSPELVEVHGVSENAPAHYVGDAEDPFFDGDDEQERAIYLFTDNIRPCSERHVRALVTHEVGHALGMDEDEVRAAMAEAY